MLVTRELELARCRVTEHAGIGDFQNVTMRLIAERVLGIAAGNTFVRSEVLSQSITPLPPPKAGHRYHAYCSPLNPGASALMMELAHTHSLHLATPDELTGEMRANNVLCITTHAAQLTECDHMLLYLTSQTWTRGAESDALGAELTRALDLGVHVLRARALAASRQSDTP